MRSDTAGIARKRSRWPGADRSGDGARLDALWCLDDQLTVARLDARRVAVAQPALEDGHRERVLQAALDHPLQRAGAVGRVVALLGEQVERGAVDLQA